MATRAKKSGINADVQMKLEANYPHEEEAKAKQWIEEIVGVKLDEDFFEALKDGSVLCRLLNHLEPGLVPAKYERSSHMPFQQIDVINNYLKGCRKYGMSESDLFVTLDLHEAQNKVMVIASLFSLGRQAQKKGFAGPVIGPKEAEPNVREFSDDKLREGRNVIGLQMGTNQVANQTGMTPYGHSRQIADTRTV